MYKTVLFGFVISSFLMSFSTQAKTFSYDDVVSKARVLSLNNYEPQQMHLPKELEQMNYDDFRKIHYIRQKSPWYHQNIPFELQFFHLGSIYKNSVRINEVLNDKVSYIPYKSSFFTNDEYPLNFNDDQLDYAGFRLHYPLNKPDYYDELIAFLGASYFRALGQGQKYGISARGLAIDTGLATGEEFPIFKEFWIVKPRAKMRHIVIYALLDSPRITGAYSFFIIPGKTTKIDVTATLFARENIQKIGIAPLTSMYLFGENTKNKFFDYRPEVHDSDGLSLVDANGEWIWRPLDNINQLRMSSFSTKDVKGFGLFQRDRNPDHYQDMEAYYESRPSVFVEPQAGFSSGKVHLIEIPSDKEIHDNVVAFFLPDEPIKKGETYTYKYRLHWTQNSMASDLLEKPVTSETMLTQKPAFVANTFVGVSGIAGASGEHGIKYAIDFQGKIFDELHKLYKNLELIPNVSASEGEIRNVVIVKNTVSSGYRIYFDFYPNGKVSELRAGLQIAKYQLLKHKPKSQSDRMPVFMSEIWSYQYLE